MYDISYTHILVMDTEQKENWYKNLNKSSLTPPSYVFGYVWPILYILIILSFVIYVNGKYTSKGIILYITQFILNLTWTKLFFEKGLICISFLHLAILNVLVFITYTEFIQSSWFAGNLLIPYMIWILFALYLNYYICVNN